MPSPSLVSKGWRGLCCRLPLWFLRGGGGCVAVVCCVAVSLSGFYGVEGAMLPSYSVLPSPSLVSKGWRGLCCRRVLCCRLPLWFLRDGWGCVAVSLSGF